MAKGTLNEAQIGALAVGCPQCGASRGKRCVTKTKLSLSPMPHKARIDHAKELAEFKERRAARKAAKEQARRVEADERPITNADEAQAYIDDVTTRQ
jgi:predicted  nucleic acid-binding Zn-ribbon protein